MNIVPLTPEHFADVLVLGNHVHGENYLTPESLNDIYHKGLKGEDNASFLTFVNNKLAGFRLTYAPGNWPLDQWCTPELWKVPVEQTCYFKCSAVDENLRGQGIAKALLTQSIEQAKKMGARAGLAHCWRESPDNSAVAYFTRCGGKLVKDHPGKWNWYCIHEDYHCPICDQPCECVAAEMIIYFD